MVKTLHEAGIEVILDVVYNHTAEGNHLGPMLSFKGIDNAAYYRARRRQAAVLHGLHRHRQHAEHAAPARAAADHGQPALLGARDARRRLPLRPRGDAGARAARRRSAVGVLRSDPAGSGGQPGQADRRAVGRRRRRLSGRQLPAALVGVERQVPRHGARLLARHGPDAGGVRATASPAARTCTRARRGGRTRASTSSPRTTASRCAISSRTTRSTTRPTARTTATARATTDRGTAASRGRPTNPEVNALRARQQRNFLATLLLSQGVPMLLGGDEIGRTQQRQQQRLLPGQRDLLVRLGARRPGAAAVHAPPDSAAAAPSGVLPPPLVPGTADPRHRGQRHRLVHAGRQRDDRRGLAAPASPSRSACS